MPKKRQTGTELKLITKKKKHVNPKMKREEKEKKNKVTIVNNQLLPLFSNPNPKTLGSFKSSHKILTVGDGNLTFTLSLAMFFGANKIIGTVLDTHKECIKKYTESAEVIQRLRMLKVPNYFRVDATNLGEQEWFLFLSSLPFFYT